MAPHREYHPHDDRDEPGRAGDGVTHAVGLVAEIRDGARAEAIARARQLEAIGTLFTHTLETAANQHHRRDRHGLSARELRETVFQETVAEVEIALLIPRGTAQARVQEAIVVTSYLPEVLNALATGSISWDQARVMIEHWSAISCDAAARTPAISPVADDAAGPDDDAPAPGGATDPAATVGGIDALRSAADVLVEELVDRARFSTPAQLRNYGHRRRRELGAPAAERAHRMARLDRSVWVTSEDDGMAHFHAILEAHQAIAACDRIDRLARTQEADGRSIGQRRADVLTDLLLDAEPPESSRLPRGVRGTATVLVPAGLLAAADPDVSPTPPAPDVPASAPAAPQATGEPAAQLLGYGPITVSAALEVAATCSSWRRILTDPGTGLITQYGRGTYAVPAGLRRLLEIRDETCRFPGCRRNATACDLDHTTAWADGGCTDATNLSHFCRSHHRTKHHRGTYGAWQVGQIAPEDTEHPTSTRGDAETAGATGKAGAVDEAGAAGKVGSVGGAGPGNHSGSRTGYLRVRSPLGTVRTTVPGYTGWKAVLEMTDLAEPLRATASEPASKAAPSATHDAEDPPPF